MGRPLSPEARRILFHGERRRRKLALDTMCFLYAWEENPDFGPVTRALFDLIERGEVSAIASVLALTECLALPYREGREDLIGLYRGLLTSFPNLEIVPVDAALAIEAARLRGRYRLKTPDAIHVATAGVGGADCFVTAEVRLPALEEIDVLVLSPRAPEPVVRHGKARADSRRGDR